MRGRVLMRAVVAVIGALLAVLGLPALGADASTTPSLAAIHAYDPSANSRDGALVEVQAAVRRDAAIVDRVEVAGGVVSPPFDRRLATNSADDVAGLADEAFGAGDAMASRYLKAMSDSPVDIPQGWAPRVADNGNGVVFQRPGATGNADMIRVDDSGAAATTSRRTHDIDEQRGSESTRTRPR